MIRGFPKREGAGDQSRAGGAGRLDGSPFPMREGAIVTTLMGFNVSDKTGVAFLGEDGTIAAWSIDVDGEAPGVLFKAFEDRVFRTLRAKQPDAVAISPPPRGETGREVIEDRRVGGVRQLRKSRKAATDVTTLRRLYGQVAVIYACAERLGISCREVKQTRWRAAFGLKPPADAAVAARPEAWRKAAVERCRYLGVRLADADAAEAAGVVWWLREEMSRGLNAKARAEALFAR